MKSEVFPLQWRQVDFDRGEVTLDTGTTKNGEGRTFVMTLELRKVLEEQDRRRKATGQIVPWVFFRMVGKRGGRAEAKPRPITSFTKAWKNACRLAGCPGRIPHDSVTRRELRRSFRCMDCPRPRPPRSQTAAALPARTRRCGSTDASQRKAIAVKASTRCQPIATVRHSVAMAVMLATIASEEGIGRSSGHQA
jgi:integrase